MTLEEAIYKRKSVRSFSASPLRAEEEKAICDFYQNLKPLDPTIRTGMKIYSGSSCRSFFGWKAPYYVAVYSQAKPGYLLNAGFQFEQLVLFLAARGFGTCWVESGNVKEKRPEVKAFENNNPDLELVILIAFGHPKDNNPYRDEKDFKRKKITLVMDEDDNDLYPAYLAPSALNQQPWFFTHQEKEISVYCNKASGPFAKAMQKGNEISIGIALSHIYVSSPENFSFYKTDRFIPLGNYDYIGTFTIHVSQSL